MIACEGVLNICVLRREGVRKSVSGLNEEGEKLIRGEEAIVRLYRNANACPGSGYFSSRVNGLGAKSHRTRPFHRVSNNVEQRFEFNLQHTTIVFFIFLYILHDILFKLVSLSCTSFASNIMAKYRCDACIRIQLGSSEPTYYGEDNPCFKHHVRGYDLRDAASKGCLFCEYLWGTLSLPERLSICPPAGDAKKEAPGVPASFQIFRRGTSMNQYTVLYKFPIPKAAPPPEKSPHVINGTSHGTPIKRQVRLVPTRGNRFLLGIPNFAYLQLLEIFEKEELEKYDSFHPGASTWSDQTIAQISKWIHECAGESGSSKRHSCCTSTGTLKWTPHRLLAVGTLQSPVLKLHLQQDVAPGHHYMTLSHCEYMLWSILSY